MKNLVGLKNFNMKKKLAKITLIMSLFGFVIVSFLLFTNHGGYAIKISNYLFFILSLGIVLSYINNDQKLH